MAQAFPPGRPGWQPGPGDSHGNKLFPHVLSPAGALMRDTELKEFAMAGRNRGADLLAAAPPGSSSGSGSGSGSSSG